MNGYRLPADKIIDSEKLLKIIRPGSRIFISSGPAIPAYSVKTITTSDLMQGLDLEVIQLFSVGNFFGSDSNGIRGYRVKTFSGPADPECEKNGSRGDLIPANVTEIPFLFSSHAIEIDIAIVSATPPDKNGNMSLGIAADVADSVIRNAKLTIAEINSNMPFTYGSTIVKPEQFDYTILSNLPVPEKKPIKPGTTADNIGRNISTLIQDGSTVVLHSDILTESIASHLRTKRNLGIVTNEFSDWIIPLIESGVISSNRECYEGGKVSASYCYGSKKLYTFVNRNPLFGFYPISRLVEMSRFNDIADLNSIMAVDKIDLTAENVITCSGDNVLSGYENRFNFIPDISFTENCSVILAFNSTDGCGNSNIIIPDQDDIDRFRPTLSSVRYAVTEYGVAHLTGKTVRERALAMIEIAHPDHREYLFTEARRLGYIYHDQIYDPIKAEYPSQLECTKQFNGGVELLIRPVRASDEDMMRSFFYKFSDDSRYSRFFTYKAVMPHRIMQQYLNIDYKRIVSIVAVLKSGFSEKIVAEARYAIFKGRDVYEMAFLVDEEFQGLGIGTFMAEYLVNIARSRGIHKLNASVLNHNIRMLKVFKNLGLTMMTRQEDDVLEMNFTI